MALGFAHWKLLSFQFAIVVTPEGKLENMSSVGAEQISQPASSQNQVENAKIDL